MGCYWLQTVAQNVAQLDYMRHAMKSKDAEIDVLKKKWQEYQEVQDRLSGYEKDRLGEKDLLRKRAEQIDALQHKVILMGIQHSAVCKKTTTQCGLTDQPAQGTLHTQHNSVAIPEGCSSDTAQLSWPLQHSSLLHHGSQGEIPFCFAPALLWVSAVFSSNVIARHL